MSFNANPNDNAALLLSNRSLRKSMVKPRTQSEFNPTMAALGLEAAFNKDRENLVKARAASDFNRSLTPMHNSSTHLPLPIIEEDED